MQTVFTKPKPIPALFFTKLHVLSENTRTVSSANEQMVSVFISFNMEFRYTINKIEPSTVPSGILILTIAGLLNTPKFIENVL